MNCRKKNCDFYHVGKVPVNELTYPGLYFKSVYICQIFLIICSSIQRKYFPSDFTKLFYNNVLVPENYYTCLRSAVVGTSELGGRVRKFASSKFLQIFTSFEQFSLIVQNKISGVFLPMRIHSHTIYTPPH